MKPNFGFRSTRPGKLTSASKPGFVKRLIRDERGSYIAFMALLLPALIAIAGLGTEGGYLLYNHRMVQSAADNAAYSAATALAINSSSTSADLSLQAKAVAATDYNLVDGTNGVAVTVNRPPTGQCYATSQYIGDTHATEVAVTHSVTRLFSKMWSSGNVSICGRAVAIVSGGGQCVLALGTTGTVISTTRNNLNINVTGCGIFSNSSDPASISVQGNNDTIQAESIGTVGGTSISGNVNTQVSATTGNPPLQDPYASEAASWPTSQATAPTSPTVTTSCPSCSAGTATPSTGCSNSAPTLTLGAGSYGSLTSLNLKKCTAGITLSGGTYLFSSGFDAKGQTVTIQAASNIIVTNGGLSTATLNFSGGNYSIYIGAGGWTSSGTTTFGSGNYNISIVGSNWTTSGITTFGNGNYTIGITKVSGTGGNWNLGGTPTFGSGNYNVTLGGNWAVSGATTLGSGNYTFQIAGDLTATANLTMGSGTYSGSMTNWTMSGNATIGKGIYYLSGDFTINGSGNQTVTANNVTLVLTGATSRINYTANNSTFTLSAPASGWNAGIAVWEPNSTVTNPNSNVLAGGNNSIASISGVFYAPGADVQYLGNSGTAPNCTQILAKSVEFGGNSISIKGDCGGVPGVKTFGQIIALVE